LQRVLRERQRARRTDFGPSDALGEVVDSWKMRVVATSAEPLGFVARTAERWEEGAGFIVPTEWSQQLDEVEREALERLEAEGDLTSAAVLAVQRELEHLLGQAEAGFPREVAARYAAELGQLGEEAVEGDPIPILADVAALLAPAHFDCVEGYIYVHPL